MTTTQTTFDGISINTPVSYRVGSDVYATKVLAVTNKTVTVARYDDKMVFRYSNKHKCYRCWKSYYLIVGRSETVLDPHF